MTTVFTLSDILARGVVIEWHEGVAVVREVAQRLLSSSESSIAMPDLHQITVSSDGELNVIGGTRINDPVRRVGQLLQAILAQSQPPVQLRLLISQATAPEPGFQSIGQYDHALEFFDRPNRTAVLQSLFARAVAAPEPVEGNIRATVEVIAPLVAAEDGTPARVVKSVNRRTARLVTAAAVLICASVAGVLYARAAGVMPEASGVADAALEASDALGGAITTGLSAASERAGLGRLLFAKDVAVLPPVTPPAPVAPRPPARKATVLRTTSGQSVRVFDLQYAPGSDSPNGPTAPNVPTETIVVYATTPDDATYSADTEGVVPPVAVGLQLPRDLPADVALEDLGRIELVILEDGSVDSVKLLGSPRPVLDAMLLSAVKVWEFQPALKDGRPVRYRKTIWIASH